MVVAYFEVFGRGLDYGYDTCLVPTDSARCHQHTRRFLLPSASFNSFIFTLCREGSDRVHQTGPNRKEAEGETEGVSVPAQQSDSNTQEARSNPSSAPTALPGPFRRKISFSSLNLPSRATTLSRTYESLQRTQDYVRSLGRSFPSPLRREEHQAAEDDDNHDVEAGPPSLTSTTERLHHDLARMPPGMNHVLPASVHEFGYDRTTGQIVPHVTNNHVAIDQIARASESMRKERESEAASQATGIATASVDGSLKSSTAAHARMGQRDSLMPDHRQGQSGSTYTSPRSSTFSQGSRGRHPALNGRPALRPDQPASVPHNPDDDDIYADIDDEPLPDTDIRDEQKSRSRSEGRASSRARNRGGGPPTYYPEAHLQRGSVRRGSGPGQRHAGTNMEPQQQLRPHPERGRSITFADRPEPGWPYSSRVPQAQQQGAYPHRTTEQPQSILKSSRRRSETQIFYTADTSQAVPSQTVSTKAGPSQAAQPRAAPSQVARSHTVPTQAGPSRAGPSRGGPSRAGSSRASPSRAGSSRAGLSRAGPSQKFLPGKAQSEKPQPGLSIRLPQPNAPFQPTPKTARRLPRRPPQSWFYRAYEKVFHGPSDFDSQRDVDLERGATFVEQLEKGLAPVNMLLCCFQILAWTTVIVFFSLWCARSNQNVAVDCFKLKGMTANTFNGTIPHSVVIPKTYIHNGKVEVKVCALKPLDKRLTLFDTFLKRWVIGMMGVMFAYMIASVFYMWPSVRRTLTTSGVEGKRTYLIRVFVCLGAAGGGSAGAMVLAAWIQTWR
ncbi:hypothetical protein BCR34DRAFT_587914 [Clohesyomyces aquaticus]|uniref:Uncharacterized protein n=1 Tax=Clohesyomyces aquaticus TaxID=1231657 RepID=A0A1Y1ZN25_9PLEO|nr:hypothetical protein BCR34DRAFT_587914 [Clohesyomyces aquaticus]